MSVWTIILRDGDCYGTMPPMNEKEAVDQFEKAKEYGYEVMIYNMEDAFRLGKIDNKVFNCK